MKKISGVSALRSDHTDMSETQTVKYALPGWRFENIVENLLHVEDEVSVMNQEKKRNSLFCFRNVCRGQSAQRSSELLWKLILHQREDFHTDTTLPPAAQLTDCSTGHDGCKTKKNPSISLLCQ